MYYSCICTPRVYILYICIYLCERVCFFIYFVVYDALTLTARVYAPGYHHTDDDAEAGANVQRTESGGGDKQTRAHRDARAHATRRVSFIEIHLRSIVCECVWLSASFVWRMCARCAPTTTTTTATAQRRNGGEADVAAPRSDLLPLRGVE